MNKLVFANLIHRPLRSLISVVAIAIEVVMILSVVAIFLGQLDGQKIRTNGIGADIIVRPANASFINAVGGAPVPAKNAAAFLRLPHVTVSAPVIQNFSLNPAPEIIYGIDYPSYNALRPFVFLAGGPFQGPDDVIVDDVFTQSGKTRPYRVGDTIKIVNHPFRICGVVESGKGGRKMVPIDTLGDLIGSPGKASVFFLKADSQDNLDLIRQEIAATPGLSDYQVQTMHEWMSLMTPDHIPGFNISLNVVTAIATLVGFLVIFLSMYTAVLERTREIGILKAMGASKAAIVGMILRESAMLALAGVALGLTGIAVIHAALAHAYPQLFFEITRPWILRASLIAVLGTIFGAVYPAWMAAAKDPIDALAYE